MFWAEQYGRLSAGRAPGYGTLGPGACNSEVGMRSRDASSGQDASPAGLSCRVRPRVCGLALRQFSRSALVPAEEVEGSLRGGRIYET
jgi:hypothetical protein